MTLSMYLMLEYGKNFAELDCNAIEINDLKIMYKKKEREEMNILKYLSSHTE